MILARRHAHFYASIALACALPIIFLVGLLLRPTIPTVDDSVDELFAIANYSNTSAAMNGTTLSKGKVQIRSEITITADGIILDLQPVQALQYADVLVYWQVGKPPERDAQTLDSSAMLIGQLSGSHRRRFRLSKDFQGQQGHLILYSRGQKTLVATFPLILATQ